MFLYQGFIKGVPRELEEAAMIDGCGQIRAFFRIVFPMLRPITATVAILNAVSYTHLDVYKRQVVYRLQPNHC